MCSARCRAPISIRCANRIYAAFNYPGVAAHIGAHRRAGRQASSGSSSIKGPIIYTVASLAWDPSERMLFYTTDNGSWRDLMRLDPRLARRRLLTRRSHRRARIQQGGRIALGHPALERHLHACAHPEAAHQWDAVAPWPYGTVVVRPRRVARRNEACRPRSARSAASRRYAYLSSPRPAERRSRRRGPRFDFGPSVPIELRFLARWPRISTAPRIYTGVSNIFRYDLATGDTRER